MAANDAPKTALRSIATAPFLRLFATSFFAHLSIFLLVHLPALLRDFGATEAGIGVSSAIFSAAAIVSRPLVGHLLDTRGRRVVLIFGATIHALAAILYLSLHSFGPWLFTVRALHGVAAGFLFSTLFTIAADLIPDEHRTQGMALFGISGILPMSLSPWIGEHLLVAGGFELLFDASIALAIVAAGLSMTIPETTPEESDESHGSFTSAILDPSLRVLWMSGTLFATALATYFVFVKSFAISAHLGSVTAFFAAYSATAIVVRSFLGGVPARFGLERTFPIAILSLGTGLMVLSTARGPAALVLSGILAGAGHAYAFPILLTLFVERSDESIRGTVVALYTALFDLGGFLAGPLFGAIADAGGLRTAFRGAAVAAFLAAVLFASFDRRPIAQEA